MSRPVKIYFGSCYQDYPVDADGKIDSVNGISNKTIGRRILEQIGQIAGTRVQMLTVENPTTQRISEKVKRAIDEADAAIFIFPKRIKCPFDGWSTSQYVVSESGYAASRFRHDAEKRTFAFIEEGVNRDTLGLAFPADRTISCFRRDNLAAVSTSLKDVLDEIAREVRDPTDDPEPLLLRKVVYVKRDGRTMIEVTYRFRIRRETTDFRMRHSLWRIRRELPNLQRMQNRSPGENGDYFICLPTLFGANRNPTATLKCSDFQPAPSGREVSFQVEMANARLVAGDIVEYLFAYSYSDAFFDPRHLQGTEVNSAGLRTGGRGTVRDAILSIAFERNWNRQDRFPCIQLNSGETGPSVSIAKETSLPAVADLVRFWHGKGNWHPVGCMDLCQEEISPRWERYVWHRENFSGLAKATWEPSDNYHFSSPRKGTRDPISEDDEGSAQL